MPEQQNIEYKLIEMKKQIESLLYKALLLDGEMEQGLYEYELVEHIAYWKDGLKNDGEDCVFVVTVNNGDVAMLLITNTDELYINEKARDQLKLIWKTQYKTNIELLLPSMVNDLANDCFALTGIKIKS